MREQTRRKIPEGRVVHTEETARMDVLRWKHTQRV